MLCVAQRRPGTMHCRVGTFMTLSHQNAPSTRIPKHSVNYFRDPYFHDHLHCFRFSHLVSEQSISNVCGFSFCIRVVAKISGCRVNAISRRGIEQLGSSFGSIFLLFPRRVAGAHAHTCSSQGNTWPRLLVTALCSGSFVVQC